ncbi:hypothetical protein CSAL01_04176 [Colletotrichum salicis]|uniref:Uncharacterized protein n=1 Tax=Colletotrichum salicis TaxID=1209931 RepID=A0A135UGW2_9PEZI|nr:hypothetical protein CSAL01_04176 [Colletotrichum salicis]
MNLRYARPVLASNLGGCRGLSRQRQWRHSLRDGGSARKVEYLVVGAVTGGALLLSWQAYNESPGTFRPKAVNNGFSLPRTIGEVDTDGATIVYRLDANESYLEIPKASRSVIVEHAPKYSSSTSTSARESRKDDLTGPADDDEVDTTRKGAYDPDTGEFN